MLASNYCKLLPNSSPCHMKCELIDAIPYSIWYYQKYEIYCLSWLFLDWLRYNYNRMYWIACGLCVLWVVCYGLFYIVSPKVRRWTTFQPSDNSEIVPTLRHVQIYTYFIPHFCQLSCMSPTITNNFMAVIEQPVPFDCWMTFRSHCYAIRLLATNFHDFE